MKKSTAAKGKKWEDVAENLNQFRSWQNGSSRSLQPSRIEDIVTWSEAFTIFTLILTSYFADQLERFNILQASHPTHVPSVQWSFLAGIRSGLPPPLCGNEAHRLVDHECSTLQFFCYWGLCAFWVWWFLEQATRNIWSWLLPGHLPVMAHYLNGWLNERLTVWLFGWIIDCLTV